MDGYNSPNYVTIGIEMCVNSDGDFDFTRAQTVELTLYLANKYGLGRADVLRHYDITGKDCRRMMIEEAAWNAFLDEVFVVETSYYRVCPAVLNVRSGVGTNFSTVGKVTMNQVVKVTQKIGVWFKIGDNQFVHGNYLEPADAFVEASAEMELAPKTEVVETERIVTTPTDTPTIIDALVTPEPVYKKFRVNVSGLNVRSGAGIEFPVVKKIVLNDIVPLMDVAAPWVKIGENEYVHGDFLIEVIEPVQKPAQAPPIVRYRVNATRLNVRSGAGPDFPVVKKVISGDIVTFVEQVGPWMKIGDAEFVHSDYVVAV